MTTKRNLSVPNVEKRPSEEFIRHRLVEYGFHVATMCRCCKGWEIGRKSKCNNQVCNATGNDLLNLGPKWSERQAENDRLEAMCIDCRYKYASCSCEWKQKLIMARKYEEKLKREYAMREMQLLP